MKRDIGANNHISLSANIEITLKFFVNHSDSQDVYLEAQQ